MFSSSYDFCVFAIDRLERTDYQNTSPANQRIA